MSEYLFTSPDGSDKGHDTAKVFREWWEELKDNKGDRAELRRCQWPGEVILLAAYHRIYRRLVWAGLPDEVANDRVPALVALAARVKEDSPSNDYDSLPKAMSKPAEGSDRPRVSPNRFRQLLRAQSPEDLMRDLRRALPLMDDTADVVRLAHDVYYWGEKVQKRWAYAYVWPPK